MDDIPNILVTAFSAIGLGIGFIGMIIMIIFHGKSVYPDPEELFYKYVLRRDLVRRWKPEHDKLSFIGFLIACAGMAIFMTTALVTLSIYPDGLRTP